MMWRRIMMVTAMMMLIVLEVVARTIGAQIRGAV